MGNSLQVWIIAYINEHQLINGKKLKSKGNSSHKWATVNNNQLQLQSNIQCLNVKWVEELQIRITWQINLRILKLRVLPP